MKKQRLLWLFLIIAVAALAIGGWVVRNSHQPAEPAVLIGESDAQNESSGTPAAASSGTGEAELQIVDPVPEEEDPVPPEDAWCYSKEDVALYLHTYGHLPDNFITKDEAFDLGWDSREGNLWDVADGMVIGGDRFGNYEEQLPKERGRTYYECDVNYDGGYRGGERIVFSSDGLIYYTADHYKTFEQLY